MNTLLPLAACLARLEALDLPVRGARPDLFLSATTKRRNLAVGGCVWNGNRCGGHPLPPTSDLFVLFGRPTAERPPLPVHFSAN